MGGVLPEQTNPSTFHRILDIGCGTGSWAIQIARTYPTVSLAGIDISKKMIDYAREQAAVHQITDRIEFAVMDALLILEFPPDFHATWNYLIAWEIFSETERKGCRL